MNRHQPAEWRIGPADLEGALAHGRAVERSGPLSDVRVVDTVLDTEVPVRGLFRVERAAGDLSVRAELTAGWCGPCRRCSDDLRGAVEVEVLEVFERHPTEGETYPWDGEELDLSEMVRDAIVLELPLAPGPPVDGLDVCQLCGKEAPGIELEDATDDEPARDPRWAALDELDLE